MHRSVCQEQESTSVQLLNEMLFSLCVCVLMWLCMHICHQCTQRLEGIFGCLCLVIIHLDGGVGRRQCFLTGLDLSRQAGLASPSYPETDFVNQADLQFIETLLSLPPRWQNSIMPSCLSFFSFLKHRFWGSNSHKADTLVMELSLQLHVTLFVVSR